MLLRAGLSSLSLLCCERCRCVELLLHALFGAERLLGLARLRASAGGGRHRCFTEAAPGKRQTRQNREKHLFHLATPNRSDTGFVPFAPLLGSARGSLSRGNSGDRTYNYTYSVHHPSIP